MSEPTFEEAREELEQIVARARERQGPASTRRSRSGSAARSSTALCLGKLDAAQGKVEELAKRAESTRPDA